MPDDGRCQLKESEPPCGNSNNPLAAVNDFSLGHFVLVVAHAADDVQGRHGVEVSSTAIDHVYLRLRPGAVPSSSTADSSDD